MQTANVLVALGGDREHTVPKSAVTPSEIALLRAIHGDDAVFDVEPLPATHDTKTTSRAERERLFSRYKRHIQGKDQCPELDALFPGAAARLFETIDELELDESFFKAVGRMQPQVVEAAPAKKGKKAALVEPEAEPEDDDIQDMPEPGKNVFS